VQRNHGKTGKKEKHKKQVKIQANEGKNEKTKKIPIVVYCVAFMYLGVNFQKVTSPPTPSQYMYTSTGTRSHARGKRDILRAVASQGHP